MAEATVCCAERGEPVKKAVGWAASEINGFTQM
jgi:hypothetical protein